MSKPEDIRWRQPLLCLTRRYDLFITYGHVRPGGRWWFWNTWG